MFSALKRAWRNLAGGDNNGKKVLTAEHVQREKKAVFRLVHGKFPIGVLTYEDGIWTFSYSEEFKNKASLRPIIQFPDRDRVYQSVELWPFFGMRIPSLKQPSVQKIVETEQIDVSDCVSLLKRFGRRTVSNPYELAVS